MFVFHKELPDSFDGVKEYITTCSWHAFPEPFDTTKWPDAGHVVSLRDPDSGYQAEGLVLWRRSCPDSPGDMCWRVQVDLSSLRRRDVNLETKE